MVEDIIKSGTKQGISSTIEHTIKVNRFTTQSISSFLLCVMQYRIICIFSEKFYVYRQTVISPFLHNIGYYYNLLVYL